jgi:hypothetical protein
VLANDFCDSPLAGNNNGPDDWHGRHVSFSPASPANGSQTRALQPLSPLLLRSVSGSYADPAADVVDDDDTLSLYGYNHKEVVAMDTTYTCDNATLDMEYNAKNNGSNGIANSTARANNGQPSSDKDTRNEQQKEAYRKLEDLLATTDPSEIEEVYPFIMHVKTKANYHFCSLCWTQKKISKEYARCFASFHSHIEKDHKAKYNDPKVRQAINSKHRGTHCNSWVKSDSTMMSITFMPAEIDGLFIDWVVDDCQPFSVAERESFRRFCNAMNAAYKVMGHQGTREHVIARWRRYHKLVHGILNNEIQTQHCFLTTDLWTLVTKEGFMVVTLHYMTEDWQMQSVYISFI